MTGSGSLLRFTSTSRFRADPPLNIAGAVKAVLAAVLRVPLFGKLLGANLVLFGGAVLAHALFPDRSVAAQLSILLMLSFTATSGLAWLALRPIARLEDAAERVRRGDFSARVGMSAIADRDIARLSATMNRLLDRVQADRARIQYLAGRSLRARDIEREAVAHELRESLAQMVAGIAMLIGAARRAKDVADVHQQLDQMAQLIHQLRDELRAVADTLYPGTLEELGLVNALGTLSRMTSRQSNIRVEVEARPFDTTLSATTTAALYRVAAEVLRNVVEHAHATRALVVLQVGAEEVSLAIEDDGRGMDLRLLDPLHAGLGLFSARAVVALVGGELQIATAPGKGMRVVARIPSGARPTES
jgi:two-component system sensor histidine kinase UhpB